VSGPPGDHSLPLRPNWICGDCGRPWPCRRAKSRLRAEAKTNRTATLVYLVGKYAAAAQDLARNPDDVAALHTRIVGWLA
jgi:hypothetical protein